MMDTQIEQAAQLLASLSPYSVEEAREIIRAIAACQPVDDIVKLLTLSPKP